jgi:hypothetical protein
MGRLGEETQKNRPLVSAAGNRSEKTKSSMDLA